MATWSRGSMHKWLLKSHNSPGGNEHRGRLGKKERKIKKLHHFTLNAFHQTLLIPDPASEPLGSPVTRGTMLAAPRSQCPPKPGDLSRRARLLGKIRGLRSVATGALKRTVQETHFWTEWNVWEHREDSACWHFHVANWSLRTHRRGRRTVEMRENLP